MPRRRLSTTAKLARNLSLVLVACVLASPLARSAEPASSRRTVSEDVKRGQVHRLEPSRANREALPPGSNNLRNLASSRGDSHIPPVRDNGFLPPGEYRASFAEFKARYSTSPRRVELIDHLLPALLEMRQAGIHEVLIGGSFVSDVSITKRNKPAAQREPGDIDIAVLHVEKERFESWPNEARQEVRKALGAPGRPIVARDVAESSDPHLRSIYEGIKTDPVDYSKMTSLRKEMNRQGIHFYKGSDNVILMTGGAKNDMHMTFREFFQHARNREPTGAIVIDLATLAPSN